MADRSYEIAVLPGDGTGPEVVREGLKALEAAAAKTGFRYDLEHYDLGGERYLKTGDILPDSILEELRGFDAIFLGAIGHPDVQPGILEKGLLLRLRFELDQYINLRPVKLYPGVRHRIHGRHVQVWEEGKVDMVFVRENTEGMYVPTGGILTRGGREEVATDTRIITRTASERVIRFACELAKSRDVGAPVDGVRRVTSIAKDNVLKGCIMFQRIFHRVMGDYPELVPDTAIVDAFTQWLIGKPEYYNVLVTTNMFGDICTDLASVLQGGMGLAAGCNIGDNHAMMEPIHGSAPKHAGKDRANPITMLLATKEGIEWLGRAHDDDRLLRAANALEASVAQQLIEGKVLTYDLAGEADASTCNAVGDAIVARLG